MRRAPVLLLPALLFLLSPGRASAQSFAAGGPPAIPATDSGSTQDLRSATPVIGYDFYRPTNNVYCISDPVCASHLPETYDPGFTVKPYHDSPSAMSSTPSAAPAPVSPPPHAPTVSGPATGHIVGQETHSAHGDASFVPRTYMDYHQALALGQKILDQKAHPQPQPSLADIARSLRGASGSEITTRPCPSFKTTRVSW